MELVFSSVLGVVFVVNAVKSVADNNISVTLGWAAALILLSTDVRLMLQIAQSH